MGFGDKLYGLIYSPGMTRLEPRVASALFLILFSTQLTLTTPFSYLPAMVSAFGYSDKDRGYYAGMIASSLFVGRFIGGYFWGWLTDKTGRRPVLLISASLTLVATLGFGFTKSLWWAVTTRALQGLFNGVIVTGRAAFSEVCDDTNQAVGVTLIFCAWNSAIVIGPAIGGYLATPVKKYPSSFQGGAKKFFTEFAFLLPSLFIVIILLISIILIFFFFEETLPPKGYDSVKSKGATDTSETSEKQNIPSYGTTIENEKEDVEKEDVEKEDEETYFEPGQEGMQLKSKARIRTLRDEMIKSETSSSSDTETERLVIVDADDDGRSASSERGRGRCSPCVNFIKEMSLFELISNRLVMLVICLFGISGFCIVSFTELASLWMATRKIHGGLSFTTNQIGAALLVPALASVVLQPMIFSRLERNLGGIITLKGSLGVLAICTFLFPFIHEVVKNKKAVWSCLIILTTFRMIADISSRSCLALFINNSVYVEQAGRVNGLAFSVQEIFRVAGPSSMGSLFSWAISEVEEGRKFPLDYRFPFMILSMIVVLILLLSYFLPKSINIPKAAAEKLARDARS